MYVKIIINKQKNNKTYFKVAYYLRKLQNSFLENCIDEKCGNFYFCLNADI